MHALLVEHFLVVIEHPEIDEVRDRRQRTIGLRGEIHAGGAEIGEIEIRIGDRRIVDEGTQIFDPLALIGEALLHMERKHCDVEGRAARREFDHRLLALLLFRNLLGRDLDAGEFGEFFFRRLQKIRTRIFHQHDIDLLAGSLLPVEARLRVGSRNDRRSTNGPENAKACAGLQKVTTRHIGRALLRHVILPRRVRSPRNRSFNRFTSRKR